MTFRHPQLVPSSNVPWQIQNLAAGRAAIPQVLTAAGAISLEVRSTILDVDDAADVDFTLPDGEEGQQHVIVCRTKADTGNGVVTASNGDTWTFDAAGEVAFIEFIGGEWRVLSGTATYAAA